MEDIFQSKYYNQNLATSSLIEYHLGHNATLVTHNFTSVFNITQKNSRYIQYDRYI